MGKLQDELRKWLVDRARKLERLLEVTPNPQLEQFGDEALNRYIAKLEG